MSDQQICRVRRILEYIGPREWLDRTLARSYVQPDKPAHITEQTRIVEVDRTEITPIDPID